MCLSIFFLVPSVNQCVIVLLVISLSSNHFGIHLNGHRTLSISGYASQMYYNSHLHTLHFLNFRSAQNKLFNPLYPPSTFVLLYLVN